MVGGPDTGGVRKPELGVPTSLIGALRAKGRCSGESFGAGVRFLLDSCCSDWPH